MSIIVRGVDRENNAVVVVDVVVKNAASWTSEGTISRFSRVRPFQPSLRALYNNRNACENTPEQTLANKNVV